jgi:hypothetical protein
MKDSPFIYGTIVSTNSFTNREVESAKLESNLLNGINTTIISPRRWGKSSLVEKVITDINKKDKKTKTVIIDLFSVSGEEEFLELFAHQVIKASSSKWQEWMTSGKEFFKNLMPKLSLGIDPISDFSLSFDWQELKKNSEEVLNLPETIAKKKGIKFIICLDEFQNLSSFKDYLVFEKKLRASWQRHKSVTYCLYGSKRHMMTEIFNNPSKPFYRFGDIMLLQKIETKKWVSFIRKSFAKTNKQIDEKTAEIIDSEIHELIESQYQRAKSLLLENLDKLHALAADLMAHEVIFKENLEAIFGVRPWKSKQDILDELALEADAAKAEGVRKANLADRPSDETSDSPEAADQNAAVTDSGDQSTEPTTEPVAEEPKSDTEATDLDAKK